MEIVARRDRHSFVARPINESKKGAAVVVALQVPEKIINFMALRNSPFRLKHPRLTNP